MRSNLAASLLIILSLFLASPVLAGAVVVDESGMEGHAPLAIDDASANIVVEAADTSAFHALQQLVESRGLEISYSDERSCMMTLAAGVEDSDLAEISRIAGVISISSEQKARLMFTPNDSSASLQWGLDVVNAYEAWDISRGSHDVVVAVLDTGIDWTHPDIAANMWTDPDGYYGYNFISDNRLPMDDNINSYDDMGGWISGTYTYHGTHVAGVVGAVINNGIGVAGMANVRLMAVKVMNDSGEGTDATVASGIRWAVDNGAHIVTMSLGVDGPSTVLENAINYATNRGVLTVAASGNSGSSYVSYPAAYDPVIAVGAVDSTSRHASFSNYGTGLDISAPGVQIYSTQGGGSYQYLSGTSTAAPYVAGIAGLMLSVNPALTAEEIGTVINSTATDISRVGYDTLTGWGIINAFGAVEQIAAPTVTITDYPEFAEPNSTFSISWLVSGGSPGTIQRTYLAWGESSTSLTEVSADFSGTTWARFTVSDIAAPGYNATLYIRAYANVDGTVYQSDLLELPVHEAEPEGLFAQFLQEVQDFIFNDLGVYNFLLLMAVIIAIPAIALAARSRRRNLAIKTALRQAQMHPRQVAPEVQRLAPPPPPPPPRFEAYVDLLGKDVQPAVIRVVEGTKVVWVNRSWAPPPGIAVRSGRLDQTGEHPDGLFQSGLLIAPGDYWSVTFHKVGSYDYYLTSIWKSAKIIVEPYKPAGYPSQQAS
ncbi:MAG: S8 family serine peptidase [Thermoplasmata archaeon]|nr:S8 family serine peptidase [Thermoplasmata archaeon]